MMEKRHEPNCMACQNETRTINELKRQAINHFKKVRKCQVCFQRNPSSLKITYNGVPYADNIDKNYMVFHILVLASKNGWKIRKNLTPYCYNCYDKEKEKFKSFPDKGEYIEFLSDI